MRITPDMVNWLELLARKKAPPKKGEGGRPGGFFLTPYLEYPTCKKCRFVMQDHWRGSSKHVDWRMEVNDHLIGWTVLDSVKGAPEVTSVKEAKEVFKKFIKEWNFTANKKNVGLRAETKCPSEICDEWKYNIVKIEDETIYTKPKEIEKLSIRSLEELARQPKIWLEVEGVVPKGEVGATKTKPGVFYRWNWGRVWFGAQKPYFHEYFLYSEAKNPLFPYHKWVRVIVRAVNVNIIDPETKVPKPGTELMWRVLIPGDQTPYCLKRGMKKKWVPPKNYIPVPPEWRKGELYEKWYKWVKEQWEKGKETKEEIPPEAKKEKEAKTQELLFKTKFVVQFLSWMGPVHVRGIPNMRWFFRFIDEDGSVKSFFSYNDFTRFSPCAFVSEGKVDKKWFNFEGDIQPGEHPTYNPTEKLVSHMKIIDKGSCEVETDTVEGAKIYTFHLEGKRLKGTFVLAQEEEKSKIWSWQALSKLGKEDLFTYDFVLQAHDLKENDKLKRHWDIRVRKGFEFNIYKNPLEMTKEGDRAKAVYKTCSNIDEWMDIDKKTMKMVGPLVTFVTPIDKGTVHILDYNPPRFISMSFEGKKLKGYFVYVDQPGRGGYFERAKLPHPLSSGDPATGDYYKPFKKEKKKGWNYYWLHIYNLGKFTRCVVDPTEYIPKLKKAPKEVLQVLVCLYPRPGTISGARVAAIKFSDEWDEKKASDWIIKNKLHTWSGELIRHKHKTSKSNKEFCNEGIQYDIENAKERKKELIADHRYLHIGWARLKEKGEWGDWNKKRIIRCHAAIVDTLRKLGYPMFPSDSPLAELDQESRKYEKTNPPEEVDKIVKEKLNKIESNLKDSDSSCLRK